MLNVVFARGDGLASGIDYGLSERDHTGAIRSVAPRVLYGDPEAVKSAVNLLRCRHRYTAGVLRFAERTLSEAIKRQAIREHLAVTFPGLDLERIAATYIEHNDKGTVELHYWIANIDLATGKRINAYYHRSDRRRLRLWVQSFNDRYRLGDPNYPRRWRLRAAPKKDASETYRTLQENLLASLEKMALAGVVQCRRDIEAALIKAGWNVSRRTRSFLSVSHQSLKKPVRLVGRMFAADWRGAIPPDAIERLAREFEVARVQRMRDTAKSLMTLIERRTAYYRHRFGGTDQPDPLLSHLITLRDALPESPAPTVLSTLRADLAALQERLGTGGTPLRTAAMRLRWQPAKPNRHVRRLAVPHVPTEGGPQL